MKKNTIILKAQNEKEYNWMIRGMKSNEMKKTADCMWATVWEKEGLATYVIEKDYK